MSQPVIAPPPPTEPAPTPLVGGPVHRPGRSRKSGWLFVLFIVFAIAGLLQLLHWRGKNATEGNHTTISVARADREDLVEDLWLSAEFQPYQEVSLHSKVTGYLKSISVDYGSHVKAGEKIAELEVPELEDELVKARSAHQASMQDVSRAEADFTQADLIYQRLANVSKEHPKLVAQQEIDDARTKRDGMNAALGAARQRVEESEAEVNRTKTLFDYTVITAPFEGIITRRYVDPGALVQAGTSSSVQAGSTVGSQSLPLVDLAQQNLLRLVFPVPESAVPTIHNGALVEISVSALNEKFQGAIARSAGKVDRSTRTMHTEVDVPNPDGHYTPGMYAFVRLILQESKNALAVPVQALVGGDKPSLYIVNKDGVLEQRSVTIGLQTPDKVEIKEGLAEGELVVVGRRNGAQPGQKVAAKLAEAPKASAPGNPAP